MLRTSTKGQHPRAVLAIALLKIRPYLTRGYVRSLLRLMVSFHYLFFRQFFERAELHS